MTDDTAFLAAQQQALAPSESGKKEKSTGSGKMLGLRVMPALIVSTELIVPLAAIVPL